MGHYDFAKDLRVSKGNEAEVVTLLKRDGLFDAWSEDARGDYDLRLKRLSDGLEKTAELKQDFQCFMTGNIAVEFACRGKPSGIVTTKADYWVYTIHDVGGKVYAMTTTKRLRKLCDSKSYIRIVDAGDITQNGEKVAKNYLFRKEDFYSISLRL